MTYLKLPLLLVASALLLTGCLKKAELPAVKQKHALTHYHLGPTDRLFLRVYEQEQITGEYNVDAAGKISIPLVGTIDVSYRTTGEVEETIINRLRSRDIIKEPKLSLEVVKYRPYYILGEVSSPGQYPFVAGLVVQKAVATAGGYSIYASEAKITITRYTKNGLKTFPANPLEAIMPGDTINVGERRILDRIRKH